MSEQAEEVVNAEGRWPIRATAMQRNDMALWVEARLDGDSRTYTQLRERLHRQGWDCCEQTSGFLRKFFNDSTIHAWMQGNPVNEIKGHKIRLMAPVLVMRSKAYPFVIESKEPVCMEIIG